MTPFYVGIPTLNCYDLCTLAVDAVLASSVLPEVVFVVDNGGGPDRPGFLYPHPRVSIIRPQRNLGVARSWNLLHKLASPHPLVLLNDDIAVGRNCLEKLIECGEPFASITLTRSYEAFVIREELWESIGEFDERIWPAYDEDMDHCRRLYLSGRKLFSPENDGVTQHGPSATASRLTKEERLEFDKYFDASRRYYIEKWGGPPQHEVFATPFNR